MSFPAAPSTSTSPSPQTTHGSTAHPTNPTSEGPQKSPASTALNSRDTPQALKAQSEARTAILASLLNTGSTYDRQYQARAADVHRNAAAIARQEGEVLRHARGLGRDGDRWQKEVDRQVRGLKEFGDLQNWAEMMEGEFLVLEETLRLVEGEGEGGGVEESASGGSRWKEGTG